MASLALAMLCQFGLFRRFFRSEPGVRRRSMNIVVAGLSLTLWFAVGWAGRMIAFV
jgi:dolichyl-phosphate-mannose--protein O-mannosyl transferase